MNPSFSIRRLWLLLRGNFFAELPGMTYIISIFALALLMITLSDHHMGDVNLHFHQELYGYGLFIWGIWATSRSFRAVHDPTRREAYLLLPASTLEKLLAGLLPVTVGLGLALPVVLFVISIVIEGIGLVVYGIRRPLFNVLDPGIWTLFGYYLFVQSPFFLGAIWFRRFQFLVTVLTILLFHVVLAILVLITIRISFQFPEWQIFVDENIRRDPHFGALDFLDFLYYGMAEDLSFHLLRPDWTTPMAVFRAVLILLPPILWWIAWLRLKEVQMSDGVQ